MDARAAHLQPDLGALAIMISEQTRRQQALRAHDLSSPKSSMAWLMPGKPRHERVHPAPPPPHQASSSPSPQVPLPGSLPDEDLPAMLLRLSRACADMMNSRQFEAHWTAACCYTDDFGARLAARGSERLSLQACVDHFRSVAARRPGLRFDVSEDGATVSVDEGGRGGEVVGPATATVFLSVEVRGGREPGIVEHEIVVMEWRRQGDGAWKCGELVGLRGVLGNVV